MHVDHPSKELWLQRLRARLLEVLDGPGVPVLDIEWLLLRCDDTLAMEGDWRQRSLHQLVKDVQDFNSEFPGYLPDDLLRQPGPG
ncbi:uncharacterized protein SOCE26_081240 [Sorangium cellulosum]|uniref:Uncharacterized protein n=1 Tax=Sorangium cellulosum TaxID=56 RepID=A0A2L0F4U4_SORCE|nr:hypothetical protein [Sorangium cellulosum]AUX46618.1 uncharacterized protein SOCE26_081240 [Sorangium cellulosum]